MLDLAGNNFTRLPYAGFINLSNFQKLSGCADWRQRVAQLMRQHRQKLVFTTIGVLQLFFGTFAIRNIQCDTPDGTRLASSRRIGLFREYPTKRFSPF